MLFQFVTNSQQVMTHKIHQIFLAAVALLISLAYAQRPVLEICKKMDRKLGEIVDKKQPFKICDTRIQLLQGEAVLIPRNPPCPTTLYDVQFTGGLKDPISNSVVKTELLYENQRLYISENRIIPNGFLNNFLDTTRSLQMTEDADTGKNLVSVACKITDPAVKSTVLRVVSSMYPDVDCNCSSIY